MWAYINSEPRLWTVGFYDPIGRFQTDSDHDSKESTAERVHYLNGGSQQAESKTDDRAERVVAQMIFQNAKYMAFWRGRFRGFTCGKDIPEGAGVLFAMHTLEDRAECVKAVRLSLQAGHVYEEVG